MSKPALNYYQAVHVAKVKTDVAQFTVIQTAIDAITDNAIGKRYAVYVHPGTYTEQVVMEDFIDLIAVGGREETIITHLCTGHDDITVTGEDSMIKGFTIVSDGDTNAFRTRCVSNALDGFEMVDCILSVTAPAAAAVTFIATASCGISDCQVDIAEASATAASLDTNTENYTIYDTLIGGATTSLLVTTCLTLVMSGSTLSNLLNHDACATSTIIRDCILEEIDLDGATLFELHETYVETIAADTGGTVVAYGGTIRACSSVVTASFVWWLDDNRLEVIENMLIADALALADSGDLVHLAKGTFAESNLAPATGVDIVGEGYEISQIVATDNANPIVAVGDNVAVTMRAVQISNLGTGGAITVLPVAGNSTLVLEDCDVVNAGVSDCVTVDIGGAGTGTLTARRTDFTSDGANSIVVLSQTAGVGQIYFNSDLCSFTTSGGATNAAIECSSANVVDVNVRRATFSGCTLAVYSTGDDHTIDIDDSDFATAGVELAGNAPVVNLTKCDDIGSFPHSVACTVTLSQCRVSGAYIIGGVAGVVNADRTQFAAFTNGGSGAISFEECNGTDINNNGTSTVTIEGGSWNTVLQAATAGIIDIYEANVATELDCGATGAINAYNCEVTSIDSNGGTITLYGGTLLNVIDNTGVVVWWEAPHRLRVLRTAAAMKIMDAADAAAAGDTISIGPGTFSEVLDLDAAGNACTYKGHSRDDTIITQATGDTVLVDGITGVVLENLTINLTAGTDGDCGVKLDASATATASVVLRNVDINATRSAGVVYGLLAIDDGANVATVTAFNSDIACAGGATSYAVAADDCDTATSVIRLYNTILNGQTYDVYDDMILIELHQCEMNGAGVYVADNIQAEVVAYNKEPFATVTPVTFAGAANGVFADLGGCELWTCVATVDLYEWVYVSAANTILEADADGADTHPSIGVVVWKPDGAAGLTSYVKKDGYLYKPAGGWAAGAIEYLDTTAGQETETRPDDAVIEILGVAKNAQCMLVDVVLTDAGLAGATKWLDIPIAWAAGSAPTGTHVDGNSRRAVAIAIGGQSIFSQMVPIPKDFQAFSKLIVTVIGITTGTFDWTAYSSAASSGEDEATHSDTGTADGQAVTDDEILDHDISVAADGYTMVQDDKLSVEFIVDVITTTTQLLVLGFKLEYIPTK